MMKKMRNISSWSHLTTTTDTNDSDTNNYFY